MAFCKICDCGNKIVFERRSSYPDSCPMCGRGLLDYEIYDENDPIVKSLLHDKTSVLS